MSLAGFSLYSLLHYKQSVLPGLSTNLSHAVQVQYNVPRRIWQIWLSKCKNGEEPKSPLKMEPERLSDWIVQNPGFD